MSRSRKHTPVSGNTTAVSEKSDKKIWHSRMRARQRDQLAHADDQADDLMPVLVNEVSNPYSMAKDGRSYQSDVKLVNTATRVARRKCRGQESQEGLTERELVKLMAK